MKKILLLTALAGLLVGCDEPQPQPEHSVPACTSTNGHQWTKWEGDHVNICDYVDQTRTCTNCGVKEVGHHR